MVLLLIKDTATRVLTDTNEAEVKQFFMANFKPDQEIEIWIDGELDSTDRLGDIFN